MIPAVAQTLAKILAGGTSLISTEQIDFNHPSWRKNAEPGLNLYCYDLRANSQVQQLERQVESSHHPGKPQATLVNSSTLWFDVSFLVSAWNHTALGEQRLLSEALVLLLQHRCLHEELLTPELRGHGDLSLTVCRDHVVKSNIVFCDEVYVVIWFYEHPAAGEYMQEEGGES